LFAAAVALGVVALALLAAGMLARGDARVTARLGDAAPDAVWRANAWWQRLAEGGEGVERWFKDDEGVELLLVRAGWRSAGARTFFYIAQAGLPLLALLVALPLLLRNFAAVPLLAALFGVILALLLPRWWLRHAARERQARIRGEVPLFINLMLLLFEAGLSTRQALQSLIRDGGGVLPELGREFRLVLRQMDAGGDLGEILASMGRTLDVAELGSVLGVLRQVERYGGQVREPLSSALAVIEERRGLDLRERVNLLAGRMTVVMVLFFFPALMLCVAGPAFTSIFKALKQVTG
jgi:tight adherence protein C